MNRQTRINLVLIAASAWVCGATTPSTTHAAPARTARPAREMSCPHALAAARQTLRRYNPERGTEMAAFTAVTARRTELAGEITLYVAFRQGIIATQKLHRVLNLLRAARSTSPGDALRQRRLAVQIISSMHQLRIREARADDRVQAYWRHLARLPGGLPGLL